MYVNGKLIPKQLVVQAPAIINIVPFTFLLQDDQLIITDSGSNIRLDANQIVRVVTNKNKQKVTLLNQISLSIEPGQLVALVGGSGAGKSTFLRTLLGIEPTTSGTVYLNGEELRRNFSLYRNQIGYVPQTDIVHRTLTVEEVLTFSAQLRLPRDINISTIVERTLQQIEMQDRRQVLIQNLSGGQLKRVSIGVELLVDPKLFFLDEPTSGLDPGLDKKMMQLLRRLADEGRTIILVTHATGNINLCDRLVFMGKGGNLCYYGTPQDAATFFRLTSEDFADVYIQLDQSPAVEQTAEQFRQSSFYQRYVQERLGLKPATTRRTTPPPPATNFWQQTAILTKRYGTRVLRDPSNLAIALLTAPIGIFLIDLAVAAKEPFRLMNGDSDPKLAPLAQTVILVFTSAAIWVGLANSLQEIVKEKDIYARERLVNLNLAAYFSSKLLILGGLAIAQTLAMFGTIRWSFSPPEADLIPWSLGILFTSFLTIMTANCLGLLVSTIAKTSTQANTTLPLLLLPQIIFSGVIFKIQGIGTPLS